MLGDVDNNAREPSTASWVRLTRVGDAMHAEGQGRGGDEESAVPDLRRSSVIRAPGGRSNGPSHIGMPYRPIAR